MEVGRSVGVRVVMAVMRRPPHRPALHGGGAGEGEKELTSAAGTKRPVREVAMIESGDREHAGEVGGDGDGYGDRAPAEPEDREATDVHESERQQTQQVHLRLRVGGSVVAGVTVEPAQQRRQPGEGHPRVSFAAAWRRR